MKIKIKKNYLIGTLLSTFLIIGIINITNGQVIINTNPDISKLHTPSLFSLFLGDNDFNSAQIKVNSGKNYLNISNGLIVGNNTIDSYAQLSVIGGGKSNVMKASNAGIGGGYRNQIIAGEYGAIGGGSQNKIGINNNANNGIIVGGSSNTANGGGIILGGELNQISKDKIGGIILGGKNNLAGNNSLILGSNSIGGEYALIWNLNNTSGGPEETNTAYSARINANSGMLIGTYNPINGVSLVVSGSIKLGSSNVNNTGGIYIDSNKCIKFYDGSTSNTLGKVSEYDTKCLNRGCNFGITSLHNGDKVVAYSKSYAQKCDDIKQIITCNNGELVDQNNGTGIYIYPYCYDLSPDPSIQVEEGKQNCPKLVIEHAIYLNPYFTQKLNKNTNEYTPKNGSIIYDPTGQKDCSFTCKDNFEWNKDHKKCYGKTRFQSCSGSLPDNTFYDKNTFTQQWDGFKRSPEEVMERHFSENYSGQPCEFTCKENYEWNDSTKTCEAKDLECRNKPRGSDYSGYILGSSTYKYGYTPTSWTHTENNNPGTCQFTCKTNYKYITGTNTCEPDTLICDGTKPTYESYHTYGSGTYVYGTITETGWNYTTNSKPGACQFTCINNNYEYSESKNSCIPKVLDCTGTKPSGNGYKLGSGTYVYGTTNKTSWDYTVNNNPGRCQFTCNEGYKRNSQTNKCEQTIPSPVCGKEQYTCSEGKADYLSNNIVNISGTFYYLDNYANYYIMIDEDSVGAAWICKNGDKVVNCGCEYENQTCPYAYIRDPEKKMCKYSPRFCIGVLPPNAHNQKYIEGKIINNSNSRKKYRLNCFDKTFYGGENGEIWTEGAGHSLYSINLNNHRLENVKYPDFTVNSPNGINGKYFYTYSGLDSPIYNSTKIEYNNEYVKNFMNHIIENQYCKLEKGKGVYSTYLSPEHIDDYGIGYYLDCDIPDDVFESGRNPDYYYDNINAQNRYHDRFYINTKQTDLPYCQ